jgi:hypothetical protein
MIISKLNKFIKYVLACIGVFFLVIIIVFIVLKIFFLIRKPYIPLKEVNECKKKGYPAECAKKEIWGCHEGFQVGQFHCHSLEQAGCKQVLAKDCIYINHIH